LYVTSKLPGCFEAYGMPDLHPGPIGASILTRGVIYPELVDQDIGCGMCFVKTGIPLKKLSGKKLENLRYNLKSIDCPWKSADEEYAEILAEELKWGGYEVGPVNM
jgi:release factor H-coupled RctB family protein